jgi:hypothetical protein
MYASGEDESESDEYEYEADDDDSGNVNVNNYQNSKLPKAMLVLALCENVQGPLLKNVAPAEYTQGDAEGLIVRCLMVAKENFIWDPYAEPPKHVPSLSECLSYIAERVG